MEKGNEKQPEKQKINQGQSNILVAIRVRPLNQKETNSGDWDVIRVQDNLIIILDPIQKDFQNQNKKMLEVYHRSKEQRYAFDKIFRNQSSVDIYNQTVRPLIRTVLSGKNATVFAYGPTGTGKTYTMLGNQQTYGLNVLAIQDIFKQIQYDQDYDYSVIINYVQIYNQMIRDLLVPTSGYLQLRDDSDKGVTIAGVTEYKAESTQQVMNWLLAGNKRRTTEATNANQTSSRSHAVFQINITKKPKTRSINVESLIGKLSLIDLAGSERGTVTQNRGIRLMEGAKINRSLLALANCINALGDKNKKGFFVPYRDSKLTRLLKDSLGGNCKTVMISNISPASSQFEETINSLKYANRAKNIKTKAITNKQLVSIHISEYKNIINDLRSQIQQLKNKLQTKGASNQNQSQVIQPIHSGHNFIRKEGQVCACGRIEEGQQIKKIKEQIFQNFNQRIQLRRALMEIQDQNSLNYFQIKRKQTEITQLRQTDANQDSPQGKRIIEQIKNLSKVIHTLKLSSKKNLLKKQITNLQLQQSMQITKKIREDTNRRIRTKQNRDFLEIIIKNHILELQNIELQINLQIQQKIIGNLQGIAEEQQLLIASNHLTIDIDSNPIENEDNIQLQIDEEEEGEIVEENEQEEVQPQVEIVSEKRIKRNKSSNKIIKQNYDEQGDRKNKELTENNSQQGLAIRLKRDREKDRNNYGQNVESSHKIPPINSKQKDSNSLDLNLKGVNLKLNQKLPFAIIPKDKKKR